MALSAKNNFLLGRSPLGATSAMSPAKSAAYNDPVAHTTANWMESRTIIWTDCRVLSQQINAPFAWLVFVFYAPWQAFYELFSDP